MHLASRLLWLVVLLFALLGLLPDPATQDQPLVACAMDEDGLDDGDADAECALCQSPTLQAPTYRSALVAPVPSPGSPRAVVPLRI
jgi:hypothetical protein